MERNAQHNKHNIFGQIVPGKTPKGKLILQMRKYIKLQQIKRYKNSWQNSDNLLISPVDIPHCYPHANTATLLTLQDNLLSLQNAS